MGQTLSAPVTDKHSEFGADDRYMYAVSEMQGWRISMEDAHTTILNLDENSADTNAFFAVYDGHGGANVAQFSGDNVHKRLAMEETYHEKQYNMALKKAFLGTDEDIRADPQFFHDPSGCTAVAALLTRDKVYVANAGDSRSIISIKGRAKPLSYDHKPQNETESSRITAAGGYIEYGRVNGNLALSRAIGDFEFKKNWSLAPERQIITADPDIIEHTLTDEDEFIVLACDGIWDCLSSQQVVDVVRRLIHDGKELTEICDMMMDICLAPDSNSGGGIGCDNMTVLIVALLNGRTKEEWYSWVGDRVAQKYDYETPEELPQIYARSRMQVAQVRGPGGGNDEPNGVIRIPTGGLGGLARALAGGGISFHPGSGVLSDAGTLMFAQDDSDEDDSEEEAGDASTFFNSLRAPAPRDVTKSLKAQLDELGDLGVSVDEDADGAAGSKLLDIDGEAEMSDVDVDDDTNVNRDRRNPVELANYSNSRQGEAPRPPHNPPPENEGQLQLTPQAPSGDVLNGTIKIEGFLDVSEDPFKSA